MAAKGQTYIDFDQRFFDTVMRSPGVKAVQLEAGQKALARARATAPIDSGDYKKGLGLKWVKRGYRDALIVEGTDPKTLLIEAKTGNLARALKSVGRG